MLKFFGRREELGALLTAWKQAKTGKPQVVTLIADTGVGKTRLVQALYEHLVAQQAQQADAADYWPPDLGIGRQRVVNPSLDRFGEFELKASQIPWLWWGMYWTDDPNDVTNGLNETCDYLRAHLGMLQLNDQCDKSAIKTALGMTTDFAIGLASAIPVVGQFAVGLASVAKLSNILRENHQKRQQMSAGHRDGQNRQFDDLIDELMLNLEKQFASTKGVPMVVFLDDVHFATDTSRDEKTLQFLDRLLRTAATKAWPLLVVATHWKAPWQSHRETNPLSESKPWRTILTDIAGSLPDGRLTQTEIHLRPLPQDDLAQVARTFLPGLSDENLAAILQKVDNVRWLVELLRALSDRSEYFERNDRTQPLSPLGLAELDSLLSQQDYLGVIRQRLMGDGMRNTRAVLGAIAWHTHGLEFISPLAEVFGKRLVDMGLLDADGQDNQDRVRSILQHALDPDALIEGEAASNASELPDVVRFPERGYVQVAKGLLGRDCADPLTLELGIRVIEWMRSSDEAPARWRQWNDPKRQKVFLGIAIEVLDRLRPKLSEEQKQHLAREAEALDGMVASGDLTESGKVKQLERLNNQFSAQSQSLNLDGAGRFHALAVAELCGLLFEEGQSLAWRMAFSLAEHPDFLTIQKELSQYVACTISEAWQRDTDYWELLRGWLQARLDSISDHETDDDRLRDKAVGLAQMADLDCGAGDMARARAGYEASLSKWEHLIAAHGETPERLRGKTIALDRLADLDRDAGDTARARAGYEASLAISEHLLTTHDETPDPLRDKTIALESLADLDRRAGDTARARAGYHLNQFAMSLMKPQNRERWKTDETGYLADWPLSDDQREAILARDYNRLLDLGGNIYFLAKIFSTDGLSFVQAVSTMTGASVEDYQAMMNAGGRSPDGMRSKKENR